MNNVLSDIMTNTSPRFNKDVTEGVAEDILRGVPDFLDGIFNDSIKSLTSSVELEYHGYRRLSFKEEFDILLKKDTMTRYDIATSDLYMIELKFTYMGRPLNRYLYLPYASRGNLIKMGGTMYHIVPVLSDTVISPSHNKVFVRLLKDKIDFKSVTKNFIVDSEKIPGIVIYGRILRVPDGIKDNIGKPLTATSLYLMGKFGLRETYRRYCGITDMKITTDPISNEDREKYIVYESTKVKPRGLLEFSYIGHDLKILINREQVNNRNLSDAIAFGIIYTLDLLPEQANDLIEVFKNGDSINNTNIDNMFHKSGLSKRPSMVKLLNKVKNSSATVNEEKILYENINHIINNSEIKFWRILLGRVSYKNSYSINRIYSDLEEHFDTLEGYLDNLIKSKLLENDIHVDDFFDLISYILDNYNIMLINSREYNSDINNRYIDILYYMFFEIIVGFNKVILNLNKRASKKESMPNSKLSEKEVVKIFNNELSPRKIYGLIKSTAMNLSMMLAETTSDIYYSKLTSVLEDQSRANGVKRGGKNQLPEATKTLRGDDLGFGSLLFLGKSAPSPRFKINPYVRYDINSGKIKQTRDIQNTIDWLNDMLQGKLEENKDILDSEFHNMDEIE